MAAQITHVLSGEEALRRASPAGAEEVLEASGPWFRLGCQGPDVFYHNQRTRPSALHYGALAHRRGYGSLVEAALASLGPEDRRVDGPPAAYLLGLATHAAIDRATHPFIVHFAGWRAAGDPAAEGGLAHPFLERLLDVAYLREARGLGPSSLDFRSLFPLGPYPAGADAERAYEGLRGLWVAGLRAAFPRATGGDSRLAERIGNALADTRRFLAMTNPRAEEDEETRAWFLALDESRARRASALLYPEKVPEGLEVLNLARAAWSHPSGDGRTSSASFTDLVEAGIGEAVAALSAVLAALGSSPRTGEIAAAIGDGSLSIADASGEAVAPRVASPLPLGPAIEGEYRSRLARARAAAN